MNKRGLALSSLVMAIPAGYLAYLCVASVFGGSESMPTALTAMMWLLIVISGLLALSPFIFLVVGPSEGAMMPMKAAAAPAAAPAGKKSSAKKKADEEDEFQDSGEIAEAEDDDGQLFDMSDEESGAEEFDDQFNFDDDDDINDAFDDEEVEPSPKKKKR